MMTPTELECAQWEPGTRAGHYESFFLRANHPTRPLAFWIRYTVFCPRHEPQLAKGELWAVWFDGETGAHAALKNEVPADRCTFSRNELNVSVAGATLGPRRAEGSIEHRGRSLAWELDYACDERPLLLLPGRLYEGGFPRAKALVPAPLARFCGSFTVDGREMRIEEWPGSRNHNWGSRHTDQYAWGQVAGFDSHPDAFLEVATARIKVGPWLTPPATLLVLRIGGREYRLDRLRDAFRVRAAVDGFTWSFRADLDEISVEGRVSGPASAFVGLAYANPPGGTKHCLNTKIAACELTVKHKATGRVDNLRSACRAAFEILTDRRDHGVEIRA